ncbi:MAG: dihydrolipoyl dehydrogenase [Spirochaetes bacterium]|nr:dihydrolipoyl dehydrogenase [Spirochaetota bacterium]
MNILEKTEIVVIGGGPAGYACAIKLAQFGKKVTLVEKSYIGGTCTNVGCIPTKSLIQSAHYFYDANEKLRKFGIKVDNIAFDFNAIKKQMNKSVLLSRKGIEYLLNKYKVNLIYGLAEVISKNKILVTRTSDNSLIELETDFIVLANGSKPSSPDFFKKISGILTSDDIFNLENLPESIAIIGGGVIGVEFATFFSIFKVKTYIIELMDHILPFEDSDAVEEVKKSLKSNKVEIFENSNIEDISFLEQENKYKLIIKNNKKKTNNGHNENLTREILVEKVLLSTGRVPNINDDLKNLGLNIQKGVITDDYLKTNIDNIYAIGDIRAKIMLAHVALYEGIVAANNICGKKTKIELDYYPSIIFSIPEIASTGLREVDLENSDKIKNKEDFKIAKFPLSANGRARTMEEKDGFAKIIYNKKDNIIVGGTIVSPYATELISQLILSCKNKIKLDQLCLTIFPHPTINEILHGAFEVAEGFPTHI